MNLNVLLLYVGIYACLWLPYVSSSVPSQRELLEQQPVTLHEPDPSHVTISNGIVDITFSKPQGFIVGIAHNGIKNVLDPRQKEDARGYWDLVWSKPGNKDIVDKLVTTDYKVITSTPDLVEVSFSKKWSSKDSSVPLNVDKRYIVRRGKSGVYAYCILERLKGWPDVIMEQIRIAFKPDPTIFEYMMVSDKLQKHMPTLEEHESGQPLAYPEATILKDTKNPSLKGEVDDKYEFALELKDSKVHGYVSSGNPQVGFWNIRPSDEYAIGGPMRQDLTSHAGPNVLGMFTSLHFAGEDLDVEYKNGEPWKKVFGPNFIYLNSVASKGQFTPFWEDAKRQAEAEVKEWPYEFVESADYPKASMRGSVSGQLTLQNEGKSTLGQYAYVLLARPGEVGSWQYDTKNYLFWTQADAQGKFFINNVRAGDYNLYAWVPGFIGEFKHGPVISITPGKKVNLGALPYKTPRVGETLWEIGYPDRSAAEFFVPDPNPPYKDAFYNDKPSEKFREYGLWERYSDLYPKNDLVFTVGTSNWTRDWFFAHVARKSGKGFEPTTWQIVFDLKSVQTGNYTLQLALASANSASIHVRVNQLDTSKRPLLATGGIGKDNAIARHGIHGLYWFYSVGIPSNLLVNGKNIVYLSLARASNAFQGHMYDYIRLEAPPAKPQSEL